MVPFLLLGPKCSISVPQPLVEKWWGNLGPLGPFPGSAMDLPCYFKSFPLLLCFCAGLKYWFRNSAFLQSHSQIRVNWTWFDHAKYKPSEDLIDLLVKFASQNPEGIKIFPLFSFFFRLTGIRILELTCFWKLGNGDHVAVANFSSGIAVYFQHANISFSFTKINIWVLIISSFLTVGIQLVQWDSRVLP